MPKNVRCNVEDQRVLDGKTKCEDITKVGLPTLEHPTTEVKSSGLIMDIDMPDIYRFKAMELAIYHNNGNGCRKLARPGTHNIECRAARQNYKTKDGIIDLEVVKVRCKCVHKSTEKGEVEAGNPYGSTEKYSIIRYEEEVGGEVWQLIDSTTGQIIIDGVDYSSSIPNLLD